MAGGLLALTMAAGGSALAAAQAPASITGDVSLCAHDLSWCEPVEGFTIYFDINGLGNEQSVLTNANGEASLEVSIGDEVIISVDPDAIPGATISPESQAGYTIDSVTGDENSFEFVFIENTDATNVLPNSGSGPLSMGDDDLDGAIVALAGGATVLAAGGILLRKRMISLG